MHTIYTGRSRLDRILNIIAHDSLHGFGSTAVVDVLFRGCAVDTERVAKFLDGFFRTTSVVAAGVGSRTREESQVVEAFLEQFDVIRVISSREGRARNFVACQLKPLRPTIRGTATTPAASTEVVPRTRRTPIANQAIIPALVARMESIVLAVIGATLSVGVVGFIITGIGISDPTDRFVRSRTSAVAFLLSRALAGTGATSVIFNVIAKRMSDFGGVAVVRDVGVVKHIAILLVILLRVHFLLLFVLDHRLDFLLLLLDNDIDGNTVVAAACRIEACFAKFSIVFNRTVLVVQVRNSPAKFLGENSFESINTAAPAGAFHGDVEINTYRFALVLGLDGELHDVQNKLIYTWRTEEDMIFIVVPE